MQLVEKIIKGERAAIAKAITLVESSRENDKNESRKLISELLNNPCLLYTSPSPRDATLSRMPSSA